MQHHRHACLLIYNFRVYKYIYRKPQIIGWGMIIIHLVHDFYKTRMGPNCYFLIEKLGVIFSVNSTFKKIMWKKLQFFISQYWGKKRPLAKSY